MKTGPGIKGTIVWFRATRVQEGRIYPAFPTRGDERNPGGINKGERRLEEGMRLTHRGCGCGLPRSRGYTPVRGEGAGLLGPRVSGVLAEAFEFMKRCSVDQRGVWLGRYSS